MTVQQRRTAKPKRTRACGKRRFRDHTEAIHAAHLIAHRGGPQMRAYDCGGCCGWHLTRQRIEQ
jgi:hypothetical protein